MAEWLDIMRASELPLNTRKAIVVSGTPILILNYENTYYAIRNQCTHQDLPLSEGEVEGGIITCPFHGAQFCLKTGEVKAPPAFEDIETYPIRVHQDMLQIEA